MAPNAGNVKLLRCVVREDLSMGMVDNLVADLRRIVESLDRVFVFTDKEVDHFGVPAAAFCHRFASAPGHVHKESAGLVAFQERPLCVGVFTMPSCQHLRKRPKGLADNSLQSPRPLHSASQP